MEHQFSITAQTCTLKTNKQENGSIILKENRSYIIPIYQRKYSWSNKEIEQFLEAIFTAYWGYDAKKPIKEPLFIGTMQLSKRSDDDNSFDVIDGQQRLTTFLMLIKVLKIKFPNSELLKTINLNWLSTKVNNGQQQHYLEETLNSFFEEEDTINPYTQNAITIRNYLNSRLDDNYTDIDILVQYVLSKIYFVVIKTQAGLAKTLQIFKAINTTGLDLNGGDIFKIRMYEYLTDKKGEKEEVFNKISDIYKKIDENNEVLKTKYNNIQKVLGLYKYFLVGKYNLPNKLLHEDTNRFFERMFDTMFSIKQWDIYKNHVNKIELSLSDLNDLIDTRHLWESNWRNRKDMTAENICIMYFIWRSTYHKYWSLTLIFNLVFKDEENIWEKTKTFSKQLAKLITIYNMRRPKLYSSLFYTFLPKLLKLMFNVSSSIEVLNHINNEIGNYDKHKSKNGHDLEWVLNGDITKPRKRKDLLCRLSALLEENYKTTDLEEINSLEKGLFFSNIHIEHIQAYKDKDKTSREHIWNTWGSDINSIGNLVILDGSLNISIGNNPYIIKQKTYKKNEFTILNKIAKEYDKWELEDCQNRKKYEVNKLIKYLFDKK